jgi:lactate 2-monooxygenase
MTAPFAAYTAEIYLRGTQNVLPPTTTDLTRLEEAASAVMTPETFGYVSASAGSGATARANRAAFDRWRIAPRMLTGATVRDHQTELFGTSIPAPVLLSPIGVQGIINAEGELATARVAAELGLPTVLSTVSSYPLEEVAEAGGAGPRWFQLYWPNDPEVCVSILDRAAKAQFSTLVVTLDTWTLGWRPRDLDHGYLPFLRGYGLATYFSDPAFRAGLGRPPEEDLAAAFARWLHIFSGVDKSWDQVAFLREHWSGPLVLKGIQHPDDARRAVDAGADGIVVSNHGGRQVDSAVGSLDVLPEIATAAGDQLTVLFDSGIRTGADIVKALALGAKAVLVGRPWVYGMACAGADGLRHVLRSLLADYDLTMALSGQRRPGELSPDLLRPSDRR